jgi:hypothetical protein
MRSAWLVTGLLLALSVCAWSQGPDGSAPADTSGGGASEAQPDSTYQGDAVGDDAAPGAPYGGKLQVLRAYVCKGIEESEPAEAGRSFLSPESGLLRLCCFSEVASAAPDTILHVWYWGDREMARVPLEVHGPRWRTWSSKRILEEWRGDWRVEITDRAGAVLTSLEFSIE